MPTGRTTIVYVPLAPCDPAALAAEQQVAEDATNAARDQITSVRR